MPPVGRYLQENDYLCSQRLRLYEFLKFTIDDGNIVWGEDWDLVFPVEQLYAGAIA